MARERIDDLPQPLPDRPTPAAQLTERIQTAKAAGRLAAWTHVEVGPLGEAEQVGCKLCGAPIRGERPVGDPEAVSVPDSPNTRLLVQRVRIAPLPGYAELAIVFDDGSRHITHGCRRCLLERTLTVADVEAMVMADLDAMRASARAARVDIRALESAVAYRTPVRWEPHTPGEP